MELSVEDEIATPDHDHSVGNYIILFWVSSSSAVSAIDTLNEYNRGIRQAPIPRSIVIRNIVSREFI